MLVGFGVAAVLIVTALFQEPLVALARWIGRRGGRVLAASARGALAGVGSVAAGGQRLTGTLAAGARGVRRRATPDERNRPAESWDDAGSAAAKQRAASAASAFPSTPRPDHVT